MAVGTVTALADILTPSFCCWSGRELSQHPVMVAVVPDLEWAVSFISVA
jgi:hypothetical protein